MNPPTDKPAQQDPPVLGWYDPEQVGTLEFFEFTPGSADLIWKWWEMAKAEAELTGSLFFRYAADGELPYDPQANSRHMFLQFAIDYVRSVAGDVNHHRSPERWIKQMKKIGFKKNFAERVMQSNYRRYRGKTTCAEYMILLMERKFWYLKFQDENYMDIEGSFAHNNNYLDVGNDRDFPWETSSKLERQLGGCF